MGREVAIVNGHMRLHYCLAISLGGNAVSEIVIVSIIWGILTKICLINTWHLNNNGILRQLVAVNKFESKSNTS